MTMVERVAKAIDPGAWSDDLPIPTRADTNAFHQRRQASTKLARAAIAAMREPSEAMRWAGKNARWNIEGGYGGPTSWEAMIDAALEDT